MARKHIPSSTCRQKLAALPSCWPGNTSPPLPADRSWLPYLPVGQETDLLCYLQTQVGCLTFLLARKHIPSATCRQKLAVLPSCWQGNTSLHYLQTEVLPSYWQGNTSPLLPADRSWLPYLPVGQETTHLLSYLQTEVGCLTFLLAKKQISSATCRHKLAALPSYWLGNTSPLLPADRSWLSYLPVGKETHPSTTCRQKSYLPIGKETHPLRYLQTEVGCLTFLLARKHISSATCRQKLAALPSCWPENTSPLLSADRSWLPYLPVGQETHPLSYLQAEVACITFLLARKHIPSSTCK